MAGILNPYSTRFIAGVLTAPAQQLYAVPSGYRAVVRSVIFTTGGTGGSAGYLSIVGSVTLVTAASIAASSTLTWDTHTVVNAGEQLLAQCTQGGLFITVSGYLLTLT